MKYPAFLASLPLTLLTSPNVNSSRNPGTSIPKTLNPEIRTPLVWLNRVSLVLRQATLTRETRTTPHLAKVLRSAPFHQLSSFCASIPMVLDIVEGQWLRGHDGVKSLRNEGGPNMAKIQDG